MALATVVWKAMKVAIHQILLQTLTGVVCKLSCVPLKFILAGKTFSPLVAYFSGGIYDNEIVTPWLSLTTARLGATSRERPTEHYGWWNCKGCRYPFSVILV